MDNKYLHPADILNKVYSGNTLRGEYHPSADILNAVFNSGSSSLNVSMVAIFTGGTVNDLTVNNDVTVLGDLIVSGDTVTVHTEDLLVDNNTITINYGEVGSGVTNRYAGIVIDRGQATDYVIEWDEVTDTLNIGLSGNTDVIATQTSITSLWSALSGETELRETTDASLSTAIATIPGITGLTSMSTAISQEILDRISGDTSLSNAIENISLTPGPQGIQGIQGTTGTQGAGGLNGTQGATGAQGTDGYIGSDGVQGATGSQGVTGAQGTSGADGIQGATGSDGVQGTIGSQGSTGSQGADGYVGSDGAQGATGLQGSTGIQGIDGSQGADGYVGSDGAQGATGLQGSTGIQGIDGSQGADGYVGSDGAQGATGSQGSDGVQGADGVQGTIGSQGSTGSQGATGSQGSDGSQGAIGVQGATGVGTQGVQGITGVGTQGAIGSQGVQGIQGGSSEGGSFTGGTISDLTITNNLTVNGYTTDLRKCNNYEYFVKLKTDYSEFPQAWMVNLTSIDNGIAMHWNGQSDITVFYDSDRSATKIGNGYFASTNGFIFGSNSHITKLTNSKVERLTLVGGKLDITTYSGLTTSNPNFVINTTFNVSSFSYDTPVRHKEINNKSYLLDINKYLLRLQWDSGYTTFTVDRIGTGTTYTNFSAYYDGTKEIVRAVKENATGIDLYYDGVYQSTDLFSNTQWLQNTGYTINDTMSGFEENDEYILYPYVVPSESYKIGITVYNKSLSSYTYTILTGYPNQYVWFKRHSSTIINNVVYATNSHRPVKYYINSDNTVTFTVIYNAFTPNDPTTHGDYIQYNNKVYYEYFNGSVSILYAIYPQKTLNTLLVDEINSEKLPSFIDVRRMMDIVNSTVTTLSTTVSSAIANITPYTILLPSTNISIQNWIFSDDLNYRYRNQPDTYIVENYTNTNLMNIGSPCLVDSIWMPTALFGLQKSNNNYIGVRTVDISGVTLFDFAADTKGFIETGITFADILFNHKNKLISYKDSTNGLHKIYNCYTRTIIKSIASGSTTFIGAIDKDTYWFKTTGSTIEIRNMSDDSVIKSTSFTATWRTYNIMFNENTNLILASGSDIDSMYSINIYTGKGQSYGTGGVYSAFYYTENYTFLGQSGSIGTCSVYSNTMSVVGTLTGYDHRWAYQSGGKYFSYMDGNEGAKLKIIY